MNMRLTVSDVSKQFPGVLALDNVNFDLRPGEVHALLGENGAGKSTLVKIITGAYRMDSGSMVIDGTPVNFSTPADAQKAGVGIIYQEFSQVEQLTVAENIYLGEYPSSRGRIDWKAMHAGARELIDRFGVNARPQDKVSSLGVATRQMIEILKVMRRANLKILLMDEPTSALSDAEARALFVFVRKLKSQGVSVIYISHRLDEIKEICDRVTVFRNGRNVQTFDADTCSIEEIVTAMIGSDLVDHYPQKEAQSGEPFVFVDDLSGPGFEHITFAASRGEVLGITGLVGAGKTEVLETLFGARASTAGTVRLGEKTLGATSARQAVRHGIGLLPESRKSQGLVLGMPCAHNVSLAALDKLSEPWLNLAKEQKIAETMFSDLEIRPANPRNRVLHLSGGNQQKVVIAKWLMRDCDVLLFDEPTRGIDVGAKFHIYSIIRKLAASGKTIIVASGEIDEIRGLCDRVLVMRKGRVASILSGENITRERIFSSIVGEEE